MYRQHLPTPAADRFRELAAILRQSRDAVYAVVDDHHWQPSTPSLAERDLAALGWHHARVSTGQPSGFTLLSEVLATYLVAAANHLGGVAALLDAGEVVYPPALLVRAALENCARPMWVLGTDLREPADRRLARAYLEELRSAEEEKKAAGRLGPKTGATYQEAAQRFQAVRTAVQAVFPGTSLEQLGRRELAGQAMPGPEAGVSAMFDVMARLAGSTVTGRQGEGLYGLLSSFTHPTLYPTREMRRWQRSTSEDSAHAGHATAVNVVEVEFVERQVQVAVVAFYNAFGYVMGYFGWPRERHDLLTAQIQSVLSSALHT